MNYFGFAAKNIGHRKSRTAITVISISVSVSVLFTLLSFNKGYENAVRKQVEKTGIHMMVVPVGCPYEAASLILKGGQMPRFLPETVLEKINKADGIDVAASSFMGVLKEDGKTTVVVGIDERMLKLKNWWKVKGRFPREENEVLLGSFVGSMAAAHGGTMMLPETGQMLKVSGVLEQTGTEDDGFMFVPIATAQKIFGKPGMITGVMIRLKDLSAASKVAKELEKIEGAEVVTMSELIGTVLNLVSSARRLVLAIILIVVAISTLGVLNTILMSVFERTRDIGVMMATGAGRHQVFLLIWLETLMLSLAGAVLGLGFSLLLSGGLEKIVRKLMPLAPSASLVSPDIRVALGCLLLMLLTGSVAGLIPALRGSRTNPIEALRTE